MEPNFARAKEQPARDAAREVRMSFFKETSEPRDNGFGTISIRFNPKRTLPDFQLSVAIGMRPQENANSARFKLSRTESQVLAKRI